MKYFIRTFNDTKPETIIEDIRFKFLGNEGITIAEIYLHDGVYVDWNMEGTGWEGKYRVITMGSHDENTYFEIVFYINPAHFTYFKHQERECLKLIFIPRHYLETRGWFSGNRLPDNTLKQNV